MKRQTTMATIMGIGFFSLCGCALLGPPRVSITSTPPRALIYVDGKRVGFTPTEHAFDFKRKRIYNLQIQRPGYLAMTSIEEVLVITASEMERAEDVVSASSAQTIPSD